VGSMTKRVKKGGVGGCSCIVGNVAACYILLFYGGREKWEEWQRGKQSRKKDADKAS
jgi:hypothetical protein